MEYKEAYDRLWTWEWDVKEAAHVVVEALLKKPDRENAGVLKTDCRAVDKCLDSCKDCLFHNLNNNVWDNE